MTLYMSTQAHLGNLVGQVKSDAADLFGAASLGHSLKDVSTSTSRNVYTNVFPLILLRCGDKHSIVVSHRNADCQRHSVEPTSAICHATGRHRIYSRVSVHRITLTLHHDGASPRACIFP